MISQWLKECHSTESEGQLCFLQGSWILTKKDHVSITKVHICRSNLFVHWWWYWVPFILERNIFSSVSKCSSLLLSFCYCSLPIINKQSLTLKLQCISYGRGCNGCSKGSSDDPSHLRTTFISNIKENLSSDKQCQKFQEKSGNCKISGKLTAIYDPTCKLPECWTLQISPFYVYRSSRILPVK